VLTGRGYEIGNESAFPSETWERGNSQRSFDKLRMTDFVKALSRRKRKAGEG
jgi:hypothetical protein